MTGGAAVPRAGSGQERSAIGPSTACGPISHNRVDFERRQRLDAGAERYRLARLPPPVGRVERLVPRHDPSGEVADEREPTG